MEVDFSKYPYLQDNGGIPYPDPGDTYLDCVPAGWKDRFLKTCDCINEIFHEEGFHPDRFQFEQVKEKFGALRCYWSFNRDEMGSVVADRVEDEITSLFQELESETSKLCHMCGQPATRQSTGWVLPYCESCAEAYIKAANVRHKTNWTVGETFTKIR